MRPGEMRRGEADARTSLLTAADRAKRNVAHVGVDNPRSYDADLLEAAKNYVNTVVEGSRLP